MSTASQTHTPGGLLADLERRQDDVLEQLEALEAQVKGVLKELGATDSEEDMLDGGTTAGGVFSTHSE